MKSYRKEAAGSASTKLAKLSGSHGTESNPGGNKLAEQEAPPRGSNKEPVIRGSKVATFARGGRTKSGKTNVNIIIGKPSGESPAAAPMPSPVATMPSGPPGAPPPPSGGQSSGPPMPAGLAPGAGVGMPPGMPTGQPMPRKDGGRTVIKKAGGGALVRPKISPEVLQALAGERAQMLPNGGAPPAPSLPISPEIIKAALAQKAAAAQQGAGTMGLLRKYGGRAMTAGAVSGEGRLEKAANIRGKLNKRSGS